MTRGRNPRRYPGSELLCPFNVPISDTARTGGHYEWARIMVQNPSDATNPTTAWRRMVSDQGILHNQAHKTSTLVDIERTTVTFGSGNGGPERMAGRVPGDVQFSAYVPPGFQTYNTVGGQPWDAARTSQDGGNNAMASLVWDPAESKWFAYQGQPFESDGTFYVIGNYNARNKVDITGPFYFGAHGGSGLSSWAGDILKGELVPGAHVINHTLQINLWGATSMAYDGASTTPGYRWPAIRSDGYAGGITDTADPNYPRQYAIQRDSPTQTWVTGSPTNPLFRADPTPDSCVMGCLLALEPVAFGTYQFVDQADILGNGNTHVVDIDSLTSEPARILARTFMDWGARIPDDADRNVVSINGWWEFKDDNGTPSADSFLLEFQREWGFAWDCIWNDHADGTPEKNFLRDMQLILGNLSVVTNDGGGSVWGGPEWTTDATNIGGGLTTEPASQRRAPYMLPIVDHWDSMPMGVMGMASPAGEREFAWSM